MRPRSSCSPPADLREPEIMELLGSVPAEWDETQVLDVRVAGNVLVAWRNGRVVSPRHAWRTAERLAPGGGWASRLGRLLVYAQSKNLPVVEAVCEIGSGLNGQRPKLKRLLANPRVQTIVVEHRDRLLGFGAEYVEAALAAQGRKLMVIESSEVKDDLVQDMLEVLTSFCARLYGRRSARPPGAKSPASYWAIIGNEHNPQQNIGRQAEQNISTFDTPIGCAMVSEEKANCMVDFYGIEAGQVDIYLPNAGGGYGETRPTAA